MEKEGLIVLGFFVLIFIAIASLVVIKGDGSECLADPLVYGVKDMNEKLLTEAFCTCATEGNCTCVPNNERYTSFIVTSKGRIPLYSSNSEIQQKSNETFLLNIPDKLE